MKDKKAFYGWVVVICCTLLAFSVNAMGNNALSFYVAPVSKTFGVNRATTNFALFTMGLLTRTIVGLFFGKLAARFGVKPLMVVGLVIALAGYFTYSFASNILMIELGSALYGIAHAIGTLSSYNVIINNWFIKSKGMVLGIINTAVGVGGMVINPLVGQWITRYGWNQSFLNTTMLIAAIAIPSLIFVKESPSQMGQMALGAQETNERKAQANRASDAQGPVLTVRRALRMDRFWLLAAVQLLIGFSMGPCFSNAIAAFLSVGVNAEFVSNVLAVFIAFGVTVGHLTAGWLYDRFGLGTLMDAAAVIVGIGLILMGVVTASSPAPLLIFVVICIGYSNTVSLGTLSHMINNVLATERADFSGLFGCLFAIQNVGIMIGSPVSGMIFDKTGSYRLAYWISALLLIVMLILLRIALRLSKQRQAKTLLSK